MARRKVPEKTLWSWLSKARGYIGSDLHINRVENMVGSGMPDVEGCLRGEQFWIELKCESRPAKEYTKIKPKFRPKQIPWLEKRWAAGGRAYVLLQVGSGAHASRYLIPAPFVRDVAKGVWEKKLQDLSLTKFDMVQTGILFIAVQTNIMKEI